MACQVRLECAFVVDQGGNDIARVGRHAVFTDDVIAIHDVAPDHGVAADAQGKGARGGAQAEGVDIDRDASFGLLIAPVGCARGDVAEYGNVDQGAAWGTVRARHLKGARAAVGLVEYAFTTQGLDVFACRADASESEVFSDVAHGWDEPIAVAAGFDVGEDFVLALGECFHGVPEVTIYKVPFIKMVLQVCSKVNGAGRFEFNMLLTSELKA